MKRISKHMDEGFTCKTNELFLDLSSDIQEMTGEPTVNVINKIMDLTEGEFRKRIIKICKKIINSNGKDMPF